MKRYNYFGREAYWQGLNEMPEGEWVRFDDVAKAIANERERIARIVELDTRSWTSFRAHKALVAKIRGGK